MKLPKADSVEARMFQSPATGTKSHWCIPWLEIFYTIIENHLLRVSSPSDHASNLQFESSSTVPLYNLRHTFEAIFVSYLMAFFFALAFEKPFTTFDQIAANQ
ncbi:hypothetical protein DICVIV_13981 [Dictyocaulus viviparus]|uniref:Uncharacterized protein n=1 Tax=Dictyocaulus viviparus TaxID=29172 RepID=A0A0D8X6C5_DICVI|nr:hypothetical protein DICVIV_13981 [Dictyocaulus viviparus]